MPPIWLRWIVNLFAIPCLCVVAKTQVLPHNPTLNRGYNDASMSGHVIERDDKPIMADVVVYERNMVDGRMDLAALCSTTTDPHGYYECNHLRPGQYAVSMLAHSISPIAPGQKQNIYTRTFYPATADLTATILIELSLGQHGTADILVHAVQTANLHGKLLDAASSVSLSVLSQAAGYELPTQVKAEYDPSTKQVSVPDIPEGSYTIKADWWASGAMQHAIATVDVQDTPPGELHFFPVDVHTVAGSTHPVADCQDCLPRVLELRRVDAESSWYVAARLSSDGTFIFPPAPDGSYVIAVNDPATLCVKSFSVSGKPFSGQRLRLDGTANPVAIDLEVEHTQALVAGKLDSSHLVPDESGVVLQNIANGSLQVRKADASGHFEFAGLVPAEYRLFAWDKLERAEFRNPDFLKKVSKQAIIVTVENERTRIGDLKLQAIDAAVW